MGNCFSCYYRHLSIKNDCKILKIVLVLHFCPLKPETANFGRTVFYSPIEGDDEYSEETEMDLSNDLTSDRNFFGKMENTRGIHELVYCSMASKVMESFPLFF